MKETSEKLLNCLDTLFSLLEGRRLIAVVMKLQLHPGYLPKQEIPNLAKISYHEGGILLRSVIKDTFKR